MADGTLQTLQVEIDETYNTSQDLKYLGFCINLIGTLNLERL